MSIEIKPHVFVGSSTEQLRWSRAIQLELDNDAEVTVWPQGVFKPSRSEMSSLIAEARRALTTRCWTTRRPINIAPKTCTTPPRTYGNVTPSGAEEIGEVGEGRLHGIDDGTACKDLGSLFQ